jgi:hypothetical protein
MSGSNGANNFNAIDQNIICSVQLELKAGIWEFVLQAISKLPFAIAAPIIQSIVSQIMLQTSSLQENNQEVNNVQSN